MRVRYFVAICSLLFLIGCTQKDAGQASSDMTSRPHASIVLRDGTKLSGTVTSSTPSEISLDVDGGGSRTILTKDVKSIEYGDAAPAGNSAASGGSRTPTTAKESGTRFHPDKTAIRTTTFEIPSGTEISVRNDETIDSETSAEGQTYAAEVTSDVPDAKGDVVVPRGANAQLTINSVSNGGKIRGASDLEIALKSISVDGQQYTVHATDIQKEGKEGIGVNKRTGEYVGGGAALGAIIGAIAGKGKGAAIGAASGAGAGALTQILTKGHSIKVPPETLMTFKLDRALRIVERK